MERPAGKNNYEAALLKRQKDFAAMDPRALAARFGLPCDGEYLYIRAFFREFRIRFSDGAAEWSADGFRTAHPAGFNASLVLYDLLSGGDPSATPSGEYVQIQNLSAVHNAYSYAGAGMYDRMGRALSGKEAELERFLRLEGCIPYGKGDVSFQVPLFAGYSAVVSYWAADEDFPASLNLFFDRNMLRMIRYETVWYAAGELTSEILEGVGLRGGSR